MDWYPRTFIGFTDECFLTATGEYEGGVKSFAVGAGSQVISAPVLDPTRAGLLSMDVGNAGRAGFTNTQDAVSADYGPWLFQTAVAFPTASTAAQTFTMVRGFRDTQATAVAVNGVYWRKTGSGNWTFVTVNGGVETTTLTVDPTPGFAQFSRFEIRWNSPTEAQGFIDDILVATHATNIPQFSFCHPAAIYKTNGNQLRSLYIDWYRYTMDLTLNPR